MVKILSFDTTNNTTSVAIAINSKVVVNKNILEDCQQAEVTIPLIEESLKEANIWYQDLNLISFTNGPGSFTGVRIGFSIAKTIELSMKNIKFITMGSLAPIAFSNRNEGYKTILVAINSKIGEFFIQEFKVENNRLIEKYDVKLIEECNMESFFPSEDFLLAGNAKEYIASNFDISKNFSILPKEDFINASDIALLSHERYKNGKFDDKITISYIKQPRISKKK